MIIEASRAPRGTTGIKVRECGDTVQELDPRGRAEGTNPVEKAEAVVAIASSDTVTSLMGRACRIHITALPSIIFLPSDAASLGSRGTEAGLTQRVA